MILAVASLLTGHFFILHFRLSLLQTFFIIPFALAIRIDLVTFDGPGCSFSAIVDLRFWIIFLILSSLKVQMIRQYFFQCSNDL